MRLTLRTLLSYLDDTLEPAQAKAIGAKVAESEQARDLMERIKQVTRRRRLTTPPTAGPGGIDANTIAEYLDNEVTPEKAAEVEQICLASDVHLAEVAACHQILTLVLGEPALVPPSAKQRMYALVKGPESIPFRKPAKNPSKADLDLSSELDSDQDDTLRMGVPAVGSKGGPNKVLLFVGAGALAACVFVFAVWQLVNSIKPNPIEPDGNGPIVHADTKDKDKDHHKIDAGKDKDKDKDKDRAPVDKDKEDKITLPKKDDTLPDIKAVNVVPKEIPRVAYAEANKKQVPVGHYVAPGLKEPAVLLQSKSEKGGWTRISGKNEKVSSGRMLLSLPGSRSVTVLDSGVELTLWGNLFEVTLDPMLAESRALLHSHDILDADLTLERGRILIRNNKKGERDAITRVRFIDPSRGEEKYFDVILPAGSAIAVERICEMDREEPFYDDPKNPLRLGPIATMRIYCLAGVATVQWAALNYPLDETHQPIVQQQNRQMLPSMPPKAVLPPWLKGVPAAKDKNEQLARDKAIEAHDYLARLMDKDNKQIDVALAEVMQTVQQAAQREIDKQKTISLDTYVLWRHAIRCSAAIDDINNLFETFNQENTPLFVRGLCMITLQQWLALGRDHDYQLLEVVRKNNIKKTPSIKIMERFHMVSSEDAQKPDTYQHLIEDLNNDLLPIRTLSHWHLMNLAPTGRAIAYDPTMPRQLREMAVREWTRLIPPGQLPSNKMPEKKGKT